MAYEKQIWNKYDDLKTEEENIENGAVVTDNRMNHIEEGIEAHTADLNNPHKVTAAQVGLGNVQNFGLATEDEAKQGISNAKYMTPSLTQAVLSANINSIAYANSADGTDGFTTVYPHLNLGDNTKMFIGVGEGNDVLKGSIWLEPATKIIQDSDFCYLSSVSPRDNYDWFRFFLIPPTWGPNMTKVSVKPNTKYTFSVYLKGSGTLTVNNYPDWAALRTPSDFQVDLTSEWKLYIFTVTSRDIIPAEDVSFFIRSNSGTEVSLKFPKVEEGSTATPYMPSASEVTTADWPKYVGFSNTVKTNKSASDYTWFPVKDSELTNKVDSHINNKSNPHSVTAGQVGAYSKSEADNKLALKANDSEVVHKTGNETIAGDKNFTGSISYPRTKTTLISSNMSDISIYKDGNSVSIRLVGTLTSAVTNGSLIGSIPAGFIPDIDWHYYCFGAGQLYRVLVRADGGLQASQDIPSGTAFRDTINYII